MDLAAAALKRLIGDSVAKRIEVADRIGYNEQTLYQIANGIKLASGKARSPGRAMREALDKHYPGWMDPSHGTTQDPPIAQPPTLEDALPVVLGHLAGLDAYTRAKVLNALRAATDPAPPLERIERDLLQWLTQERSTAKATPEKLDKAA